MNRALEEAGDTASRLSVTSGTDANGLMGGDDPLTPVPWGRTWPAMAPGPAPRVTHRLLVMRGLTPNEAANLTAYIAGIAPSNATWSLVEVSRLLFLRELRRAGQFSTTGESARADPASS
jgi:hypothetical protein